MQAEVACNGCGSGSARSTESTVETVWSLCAARAMFTLAGSRLFRLLSKLVQEAVAYCLNGGWAGDALGGVCVCGQRYAPGRGRALA